jgi:hypothetical protein
MGEQELVENRTYDEIRIGESASIERVITSGTSSSTPR